MTEFIHNIIDLAKATWDLFCMIPFTCIFLVISAFVIIRVLIDTQKKIDEAKGPIIFR